MYKKIIKTDLKYRYPFEIKISLKFVLNSDSLHRSPLKKNI